MRALAEPPLRERGAIGLIAGDAWPGRRGAPDRRCSTLAARARRVATGVRLVGFRDDVENVYGAADLVAVPSPSPTRSRGGDRGGRGRLRGGRQRPRRAARDHPRRRDRPAGRARRRRRAGPRRAPSCSTTSRERERLGAAAARRCARAGSRRDRLLDLDPVALRRRSRVSRLRADRRSGVSPWPPATAIAADHADHRDEPRSRAAPAAGMSPPLAELDDQPAADQPADEARRGGRRSRSRRRSARRRC